MVLTVVVVVVSVSLAQQPGGGPSAASQPQQPAASQPLGSRPASPEAAASELDTQRAIGKAQYENAETPPQFEPAAAAFRRCIQLAPDSAIDRFNLGLTLMRAEKYDEALTALTEAARLRPDLTATAYVMGIVQKRLGKLDEAVTQLEIVTAQNPRCAGAYYNLSMCSKQNRQNEKAIAALKRAVELAPTHPSYHYQLMTLYRQVGDVENVKRHKEIFDQVKDTIDESEKTAEALERSEYSYIIEPRKLTADVTPNPAAKVRFVDATEQAGLAVAAKPAAPLPVSRVFKKGECDEAKAKAEYVPSVGGGVALGDFDSDGDLDIYVVNCAADAAASANRLYRNDGRGRFEDVTAAYGVGDPGMGLAAVFGDYDNDGNEDLYVVNCGPNVLYHKQGHGAYEVAGLDEKNPRGLTILELGETLPQAFEAGVELTVRAGENQSAKDRNAFVIFDYHGPEDFKFAGADVAAGCWVIGHCNGAWTEDARATEGLNAGQRYGVRLRVQGGTAALAVVQSGEFVEKLRHDFGKPLREGAIGLGAVKSEARFDDFALRDVTAGEPGRALYVEDFKDGSADRFRAISGNWQVVDWRYEDVSQAARAAEPQFGRAAVFVDYDHDHDLDIFVANDVDLSSPPDRETFALPGDFPGEVNAMLRNNGNGTFSDQTDEAGLLVDCSQTLEALFADFDGDSDIDLFTLNANAASRMFINARMGKFESGGSFAPPIERNGRAAAEGDFNHDGRPDLLVAVDKDVRLYINDGRAKFTGTALELPAALAGGVGRIRTLDYNNDGWTDLLLIGADGKAVVMLAGAGIGKFTDVTAAVGLGEDWWAAADAAVGDLDGDSDEDILLYTRGRGPRLLRNDGGGRGHWIDVELVGKKVSRDAYGATVEVAAGGHYQKQTVRTRRIHFGLGDLSRVDAVRVVWPNGQAQNVIQPEIDGTVTIEQHVKVSASCAFLYAFSGRRFEIANEILGIGPLGAPMGPGEYFPVDDTELTKLGADQLAPQDGFYELRLTEELREITYADEIKLRVVDHPGELELIANEMFSWPPPEDKFYAFADGRPPVSAVDDRGEEVRELILARDGRFPAFPLVEQYDGLAEPHSLTLDLGDLSGAPQVLLCLDGWIYWAEASVTMAVAQDLSHEITPLKLEVRDAAGNWRTAVESVGLPTSKGLVVPVDLTGLFPAGDYHARLSTTMCVYFDRIFVATRDEAARCRVTQLPVATADLHYRGFSRMTRDRFGYERFDYYDVIPAGSWDPPLGRYTRYGDVTPLLARTDDKYVIFGPGDELSLRFDGRRLPTLPEGWVREFIFFADGWVKDGDLNTKFSETVAPLPFHGMSGYPYPPSEHYPATGDRLEYISRYNTRPARPTSGRLTVD